MHEKSDTENLDIELEEFADLISGESESEEDEFDKHYDEPPIKGRKFWGILILVFIVISVAVLYVYQVGDNKTILGNQPILEAQPYPAPTQAAVNIPVGGQDQVLQVGANAQPTMSQAVNRVGISGAGSTSVRCTHCGEQGMPLCSGCGAVMQSLSASGNPQLFACPHCGSVGLPICPMCGGQMTSTSTGFGPTVVPKTAQAAVQEGGQFFCPTCGATGLPNWDPNGLPRCPGCNGVVTVR